MSGDPLHVLLWVALTTGVLHTLMGPDHYLPFVAMGRAGRWSLARTLAVTAACGVGHVAGSVVLGVIGVAIGVAVGGIEAMEAVRGNVAGWMLTGFGLVYLVWGVRSARRGITHHHLHAHADGTVHEHDHDHHGDHVHVHAAGDAGRRDLRAWALFTVFIFGPCEVLIPQLMYPAAKGSWWSVLAVASVFGIATIVTMLTVVGVAYWGVAQVRLGWFDRYAHAAAGLSLVACGLALTLGL